jgi:hypothetical protein
MAKPNPDAERPALVVMEDLNVAGVMQNGKLARPITDVGWGSLLVNWPTSVPGMG